MNRTNCYAVGVKQKNAKGEDINGYLAVTGRSKIIVAKTVKDIHNFQPLLDINRGYIVVAENQEDAEYLVRWLSRVYRKKFREYAKQHDLSMDDFRFFMVKMSNPAFDNFHFTKLGDNFYNLRQMRAAVLESPNLDNSFRGNRGSINLYEVEKVKEKADISVLMPR